MLITKQLNFLTMKRKTVYLFFLFLMNVGVIQIFAQQTVTSSGGNATGSGGSVSFTVGQIDYSSHTGSSGSVNEGVQQPYEFYVLGMDDIDAFAAELSVFPNPSTGLIILRTGGQVAEDLNLLLTDINGKILLKERIVDSETKIAMDVYPQATYLMAVYKGSNQLKSIKIIKN